MCWTKILHNVEQDNLTWDSFYLDTIHDTEDSTFCLAKFILSAVKCNAGWGKTFQRSLELTIVFLSGCAENENVIHNAEHSL